MNTAHERHAARLTRAARRLFILARCVGRLVEKQPDRDDAEGRARYYAAHRLNRATLKQWSRIREKAETARLAHLAEIERGSTAEG